MTALTGTLIGDAVRQAQIEVLVEMGVLRAHEVTGPSVGTGVFGGYLYMSGSAMRLFGVRMPGMSPRDADTQVMGEVTDLPPYRRAKGDRNLLASLALSRYVLRLLRSPTWCRSRRLATKRECGWRRCLSLLWRRTSSCCGGCTPIHRASPRA